MTIKTPLQVAQENLVLMALENKITYQTYLEAVEYWEELYKGYRAEVED